jgi:hypothetical protein
VRRTILLLAVVATATLLASGIALAVNKISCPNRDANQFGNLCVGTNDPDVMNGTLEADDMRGMDGATTSYAPRMLATAYEAVRATTVSLGPRATTATCSLMGGARTQ